MPRERLTMRKVKEVFRLKFANGFSERKIARSCDIARSTVAEYLRRARVAGLTWPLPDDLDDASLERRVFPPPVATPGAQRPVPVWADIHREMKRK